MKFEEVVDTLESGKFVSKRSFQAGTFIFLSKDNHIDKDKIPQFNSMSKDMNSFLTGLKKNIVFPFAIYTFNDLGEYVTITPFNEDRSGDDWYIVD